MKTNIKTLAIKANFTNTVRHLLSNTSINNQVNQYLKQKYKIKELTDQDKLEYFDKIWELMKETDNSLRNYKYKKRKKAKINKERELRGWVKKKKTSLKEYQKSKVLS